MENVTPQDVEKATDIMNEKVSEMLNMLTAVTGMSKEALLDNFVKDLPDFMETLKKDKINISEFSERKEESKENNSDN
mgnify:CR=1 FL=1